MVGRSLPLPLLARLRRPRAGTVRTGVRRLAPRRRTLAAALLCALALAGGWWWLRDSSLVAVQEVQITGLHGQQTAPIRDALTAAALDMTTLHVREDALRAAVRGYPVVADVTASGHVPHALAIHVAEHVAVAAVQADGRSVAVAGDGTLLRGVDAGGAAAVAAKAVPGGARLTDPLALAQVRILGAAPTALRARVTRMFTGGRGLQAQLRDGPVVAFGGATRLEAKWAALTAVLADPASAGATVIDVTVPASPVATGLEPLTLDAGGTDGTSDAPAPSAPAATPTTTP